MIKWHKRRVYMDHNISNLTINKKKISSDYDISENDLIADQYILLQRGKKNYFILKVED